MSPLQHLSCKSLRDCIDPASREFLRSSLCAEILATVSLISGDQTLSFEEEDFLVFEELPASIDGQTGLRFIHLAKKVLPNYEHLQGRQILFNYFENKPIMKSKGVSRMFYSAVKFCHLLAVIIHEMAHFGLRHVHGRNYSSPEKYFEDIEKSEELKRLYELIDGQTTDHQPGYFCERAVFGVEVPVFPRLHSVHDWLGNVFCNIAKGNCVPKSIGEKIPKCATQEEVPSARSVKLSFYRRTCGTHAPQRNYVKS